jgi:hypothetical protein
MAHLQEVGNLADDFMVIVRWLQVNEHDILTTSFSFTEVGVAAVVREFPSAQMLEDVGKDTLMSRGISELIAVLLTKIAGAYYGASSSLLH